MHTAIDIPTVSRFEADLLAILQGFLGHVPRSQLMSLLTRTQPRPGCLSRAAVTLVEDMLSKGATLTLARQAWQQEKYLRGQHAVVGRLWERTSPTELGLTFSKQVLSFLMWATASDAGKRGESWKPAQPLELGDRWLMCMALGAVHESNMGFLWTERQPWRHDAFCRLCFAVDFDAPMNVAPDFTPWLTPAGIGILEASQHYLAERWVAMEQTKSRMTKIQQLRAAALGQSRILEAFFKAIDQAGRRDLARFLLIAGARLFEPGVAPPSWQGDETLQSLRLADRQQAQRDSQVVARQFEQLSAWQAAARNVGYFDEGYQAAQLWKLDWEAYNGDASAAAARRQIEQTQWL